jgi:hypothetical protein
MPFYFTPVPTDDELKIIEGLHLHLSQNQAQGFAELLGEISPVSSFERINYYFMQRYSISIPDSVYQFSTSHRSQILELCFRVSAMHKLIATKRCD